MDRQLAEWLEAFMKANNPRAADTLVDALN